MGAQDNKAEPAPVWGGGWVIRAKKQQEIVKMKSEIVTKG